MSTRWAEIEMQITLAFYLFVFKKANNQRIVSEFTTKLVTYTSIPRTVNAIGLRMAKDQSFDAEYIGKGMDHCGNVQPFWDIYVTNDPSYHMLANIYAHFLNETTHPLSSNFSGDENEVFSTTETNVVSSIVYNRSPLVHDHTMQNAHGKCELCGCIAPFMTLNGTPYLEVHHIVSLSNQGEDRTSNTIALCPNCHRKMHYGKLNAHEMHIISEKFTYSLLCDEEKTTYIERFMQIEEEKKSNQRVS